MAWAGDWGSGDKEDVEDTEPSSPKRSRPTWADAGTAVVPAAEKGLKTSPFSSWKEDKKKTRRDNLLCPLM